MRRTAVLPLLLGAASCGRYEFVDEPVGCLTDDFNDNTLGPLWRVEYPTSTTTIEETDGVIVITPPTDVGNTKNALASRSFFDFTDAALIFRELEQVQGSYIEAGVNIEIDPTEILAFEGGTLVLNSEGPRVVYASSGPHPERPLMRLRHDSATNAIFGGTSPDGITWFEHPPVFLHHPPTAVTIRFLVNKFGGGLNTTPGRYRFDDVQLTGAQSSSPIPNATTMPSPTTCEPLAAEPAPPVHIFNVSCVTPPTTGNAFCATLGLGVATEVHGYGWYQCGGIGDSCPGSGWQGTSCPDWCGGSDCVGIPYCNGVLDQPADGTTVFAAGDLSNCAGYNPGWTVVVRCTK